MHECPDLVVARTRAKGQMPEGRTKQIDRVGGVKTRM